jgi:cysteine desulfurase
MGRRASTENVAGIVGMGEAARLAKRDMMSDGADAAELRDLLMQGALRGVPGIRITGHPTCRLPNNASFCIPGVEGRAIVRELDAAGFAVSSGSACTSGELNPSHVLLAMGIAPDDARGSLRVSVGRGNTREEVANLLEVLPGVVHRIRTSTSLADEQLARA